jgi:hypothetical protein
MKNLEKSINILKQAGQAAFISDLPAPEFAEEA